MYNEYRKLPEVHYNPAKIDLEVFLLRKKGLADDEIAIVQRGQSMTAVPYPRAAQSQAE